MEIVEMPYAEELAEYTKRQTLFIDTCAKIRTAWATMGYLEDPIGLLIESFYGMSVYGHILSEET